MNRTAIREKAFQLIYSLELQKYDSLQKQIYLYFYKFINEDNKMFIINTNYYLMNK